MNDMTINQAATVLSEVVKQATGQSVIGSIATPEDFTAVAQTALKTGRDPIFNQISQMWTDTIFAVRPNQRPVSTLRMEIGRFGNAVRKLSPVAKQMVDDAFAYYKNKPLVRVKDGMPKLQDVQYTPFCDIGYAMKDGYIVVCSCIDNLLKGASAQALQILNLYYGFDELEGLL